MLDDAYFLILDWLGDGILSETISKDRTLPSRYQYSYLALSMDPTDRRRRTNKAFEVCGHLE